jgi:hypothetical protein
MGDLLLVVGVGPHPGVDRRIPVGAEESMRGR